MERDTDTREKLILLKVAIKLTEAQTELNDLAVQLTLGQADGRNKIQTPETIKRLTHKFEKLLLKLEIVRLRIVVKKFHVKDSFRTTMNGAREKIRGIVRNTKKMIKHAKGS
jgi:hypothetical protein